MKFNGKVKIISKEYIHTDIFRLIVERPKEITRIVHGQFFNIVASTNGYPLLRRPISVSGYDDNAIEFTIKILGVGTNELSKVRESEEIEIMGPLGNGFEQTGAKRILLVGGGIGIAPLKGLIENWKVEETAIDAILGYRDTPFLTEEFLTHTNSIEIVSETDPNYRNGYVTEPLIEHINVSVYDMIYACGPEKMLKSVADICNSKEIPVQLLMEEKMACGVGACLVCTCKIKKDDFSFKHVRMCTEGPMFYGSEVIFDEE